jgi:hypothetical protein
LSLSEAVNELVRAGLTGVWNAGRFASTHVKIGMRLEVSNVVEALDLLDDMDEFPR